jgi:hypothetical protein
VDLIKEVVPESPGDRVSRLLKAMERRDNISLSWAASFVHAHSAMLIAGS